MENYSDIVRLGAAKFGEAFKAKHVASGNEVGCLCCDACRCSPTCAVASVSVARVLMFGRILCVMLTMTTCLFRPVFVFLALVPPGPMQVILKKIPMVRLQRGIPTKLLDKIRSLIPRAVEARPYVFFPILTPEDHLSTTGQLDVAAAFAADPPQETSDSPVTFASLSNSIAAGQSTIGNAYNGLPSKRAQAVESLERLGDLSEPVLVVAVPFPATSISQVMRSLDTPLLVWTPLSLEEFSYALSAFPVPPPVEAAAAGNRGSLGSERCVLLLLVRRVAACSVALIDPGGTVCI